MRGPSPADQQIIKTATSDHCEKCGTEFAETVEITFDANREMTAFFCRRCIVEDGMPDLIMGTCPAVARRADGENPVPDDEWDEFTGE